MAGSDGEVAADNVFYAYGTPRETEVEKGAGGTKVRYLFTQKERDEESRLHYFGARFYLGELGRFGSVDQLSREIPSDRLAIPQKLNAFSYCRSNPIVLCDPSGMDDESVQFSGAWVKGFDSSFDKDETKGSYGLLGGKAEYKVGHAEGGLGIGKEVAGAYFKGELAKGSARGYLGNESGHVFLEGSGAKNSVSTQLGWVGSESSLGAEAKYCIGEGELAMGFKAGPLECKVSLGGCLGLGLGLGTKDVGLKAILGPLKGSGSCKLDASEAIKNIGSQPQQGPGFFDQIKSCLSNQTQCVQSMMNAMGGGF
jgi:RHS repeat-associated protein